MAGYLERANEFFWGPSVEKQEKQTRDQVNESVTNQQQTLKSLQVRRNFLEKRCIALQSELVSDEIDDNVKPAKYEEYRTYSSEIESIDGAMNNVKVVESATSKAATNVNVYKVQKDAQKALSAVNNQLNLFEVKKTNSDLEADIEKSEEITRMVSSPIKHKTRGKKQNMNDTIAQWKTQKMPSAPKTYVDVQKVSHNLEHKQESGGGVNIKESPLKK